MSRTLRPHAEAVIGLLRELPSLADEYLRAVTEQACQDGGGEALLSVLRQVAKAFESIKTGTLDAEAQAVQRLPMIPGITPCNP